MDSGSAEGLQPQGSWSACKPVPWISTSASHGSETVSCEPVPGLMSLLATNKGRLTTLASERPELEQRPSVPWMGELLIRMMPSSLRRIQQRNHGTEKMQ